MRRLLHLIGTTIVGGLLVVLPIYLAVILLFAAWGKVRALFRPLEALLPEAVPHPDLVVAAFAVLVCFAAGLLVSGFPRSKAGHWFEEKVLDRLPGYSMLRMATRSLFGDAGAGLELALVEMDDALVVSVLVERLPGGWVTVFVPSTPAAASGSVYLFPEAKVHAVDVPFAVGIKAASRYGRGAGALLAGLRDRSVLQAP
jgi:uncharacterized membrane protein